MTPVRRQLAVLLSLTLALGAWGPTTASATASAPSAAALAASWSHARTEGQRVSALERVAAALGIAVMDPSSGRFVVDGLARSEDEGYLYLNELQSLALAASAHHRLSLATVAGILDRAGYAAAGMPVTGSDLAAALVAAARESERAAATDARGWLAVKLIRALGRQRHVDIAQVAPTDLDPVQALLVVEDFTQPELDQLPVGARGTELPDSTGHLLRKVVVRNAGCAKHVPATGARTTVLGALGLAWAARPVRHGKSLVRNGSTARTAAVRIAAALRVVAHAKAAVRLRDAQHGVVAQSDVSITVTTPPLPVPLGSGPVRFGARVVVDLTLTNNVVRCGELIGIDFHAHGPVPGAAVVWDPAGLDRWGTLAPPGPFPVTVTGSDGWAWLTFTPYADLASDGDVLVAEGVGAAGTLVAGSTAAEPVPWKVSYHDRVDVTYTATVVDDGQCASANCPTVDDWGTDTRVFHSTVSASASLPMSTVNGTGDGTASETLQADEDDSTFHNAIDVCGRVDGTETNTGTGTEPGVFDVQLAVDSASAPGGLDLSYDFFDADGVHGVVEDVHTVETVHGDCGGQTVVENRESTGTGTIRGVHEGQEGWGGWITLPRSVWTVDPHWTASTGGTLATATMTRTVDGGDTTNGYHEQVVESFTLTTPTPHA